MSARLSGLAPRSPAVSIRGSHVCATLNADTVDAMQIQIKEAYLVGADAVELRLDHLKSFNLEQDLPKLLVDRELPTIVTFRPKWEGGLYEGPEDYRLSVLRRAVELGADLIDIELQIAEEFISKRSELVINPLPTSLPYPLEPTKIIVSSHNMDLTPDAEELSSIATKIQATGADIVKLATMANDITDVPRVLEILARMQVPVIAVTMGKKGLIGRLLAPKYGAFLTYGTLLPDVQSTIGQPTVKDLIQVYKVGRLGRNTKVFGLIGNPVSHSKGYILHNALMIDAGFDGIYVPFLVEDVKRFFQVFSSPDFAGFSVTIPHKHSAMDVCDEIDPIAKAIGAVNTVIRKSDGKLFGTNTDWDAAISAIEVSLREREGSEDGNASPLKDRLVVVVGAGGAGKALAFGANHRGAKVLITNRNIDRAKEVSKAIPGSEVIPLPDLSDSKKVSEIVQRLAPGKAPALANTTSVGMQPNVDETPVAQEGLSIYGAVFDAVYTPMETRLLREAKQVNASPVSGVEMFIGQAAKQFEMFTDLPVPWELCRQVVMKSYGL